jgi:hypothetical protein
MSASNSTRFDTILIMAGCRCDLKNYAGLTQGVREEIIKLAKNLSNVNLPASQRGRADPRWPYYTRMTASFKNLRLLDYLILKHVKVFWRNIIQFYLSL